MPDESSSDCRTRVHGFLVFFYFLATWKWLTSGLSLSPLFQALPLSLVCVHEKQDKKHFTLLWVLRVTMDLLVARLKKKNKRKKERKRTNISHSADPWATVTWRELQVMGVDWWQLWLLAFIDFPPLIFLKLAASLSTSESALVCHGELVP